MGKRFQSTRPHGARLASVLASALARGFNPRARMGRDVEIEATTNQE